MSANQTQEPPKDSVGTLPIQFKNIKEIQLYFRPVYNPETGKIDLDEKGVYCSGINPRTLEYVPNGSLFHSFKKNQITNYIQTLLIPQENQLFKLRALNVIENSQPSCVCGYFGASSGIWKNDIAGMILYYRSFLNGTSIDKELKNANCEYLADNNKN